VGFCQDESPIYYIEGGAAPSGTTSSVFEIPIGKNSQALTRPVDHAMISVMKTFNSAEGQAWSEKRWTETGHEEAFGCTFRQAMDRHLFAFDQQTASLRDERAQAFTRFYAETVDAYVQNNAVPFGLGNDVLKGVACQLVEDRPGLCGGHTVRDGQSHLMLNVNAASFDGNYPEIVNTAWHEEHHEVQKALVSAYENGDIDNQHPFYHAARIYAANRQAYIASDGSEKGQQAYMDQPMEAGAWAVGSVAEREAKSRLRALKLQETQPQPSTPIKMEPVLGESCLSLVFMAVVNGRPALIIAPLNIEPQKPAEIGQVISNKPLYA
jgi:hypothetical protein